MSYVELDMKINKNIAVFYYMCECGVDPTKCIVVNLEYTNFIQIAFL